MILFYGEGRLGNQLFQYQALAALARPRETIVAIGLEALDASFDLLGPPVHVLRLRLWWKRAAKYLLVGGIVRPLARFARVCNYGNEAADSGESASGGIALRSGLIGNVTFVDGGYYQDGRARGGTQPLRFIGPSAALVASARTVLASQCTVSAVPVFVHVRRGDYLSLAPSSGTGNVALPAAYYRQAIVSMRAVVPQAHFAFVTDDPAWVAEEFSDVAPRSIHSSTAVLDWALMACCRAGILSNSSFSLSAALSIAEPLLLVAPRFWMGFREARWVPEGIERVHPNLEYLDVPATAPGGNA